MKLNRYILLLSLSITLVGCGETSTSTYATYQDAVNDNLFKRGWLPDILPPTATNIRTRNSVDDNSSRGHFVMPKSDLSLFKSKLTKLPNGKYAYSYGKIMKDPTWVFSVDEEKGKVAYVLPRSN